MVPLQILTQVRVNGPKAQQMDEWLRLHPLCKIFGFGLELEGMRINPREATLKTYSVENNTVRLSITLEAPTFKSHDISLAMDELDLLISGDEVNLVIGVPMQSLPKAGFMFRYKFVPAK